MQGVPLDGYWVCLDEGHLMNREAMAVLLNTINSIFTAVKSMREHADIHGTDVSVIVLGSLFVYVCLLSVCLVC